MIQANSTLFNFGRTADGAEPGFQNKRHVTGARVLIILHTRWLKYNHPKRFDSLWLGCHCFHAFMDFTS